jgi:hypothetical protein
MVVSFIGYDNTSIFEGVYVYIQCFSTNIIEIIVLDVDKTLIVRNGLIEYILL